MPILDYLGGYFDGDGCITIASAADAKELSPFLCVSSVSPVGPELFQKELGGSVNRYRPQVGRHGYTWARRENASLSVVTKLVSHVFLKRHGLELAIEAFGQKRERNARGVFIPLAEDVLNARREAKQRVSEFNHANQCRHKLIEVDADYLAGFFDAEGSISVSRSYRRRSWRVVVSVGNRCPHIVRLYQERFGGRVYEVKKDFFSWQAWSSSAYAFLDDMESRLILKQEQAKAAKLFRKLSFRGSKISTEMTKIAERVHALNCG